MPARVWYPIQALELECDLSVIISPVATVLSMPPSIKNGLKILTAPIVMPVKTCVKAEG